MANRFWVGGSGTWDGTDTTNWATTSGGAGGASAPVAADTVFFDSNSGTAATVTVASTATAAGTTINKSDITISLAGNITLAATTGAVTLTAGALILNQYILSCGIFGSSNSNIRSIDFGTGSIDITRDSTSVLFLGTLTNFSYAGTPNIRLTGTPSTGTRGAFIGDVAGATELTTVSLIVTGGSDTINLGNSRYKNLNYTGFTGAGSPGSFCYGDLTLGSGMSVPASTGNLTFVRASGTQNITTNGVAFDRPIVFDAPGSVITLQDALTQGSTRLFRITNGTVQLKAGVTTTVGVFSTTGTNQKFLQSTLAGTQATLSQASGTISTSYLTIQDINATGGATWQAYTTNENVDAGNNDGWDFSLQLGRYIYTRRKNKRILP